MVVKFEKVNNIYGRVIAPRDILMDIRDLFTFEVPGAKFSPKYKAGIWDGKIRLFNSTKRLLYRGLETALAEYCELNDIDYETDIIPSGRLISDQEYEEFVSSLNLPPDIERRDYQKEAVLEGIEQERVLLLSPTASGKSLTAYILYRWFSKKTIIIVPTVSLVHQLASDFVLYGYDADHIHKIMSGEEKNTDKPLTISTWQSITKQDQSWYNQFDVVICDEVHRAAAASLVSIMERLHQASIRIGMTGTLDGSKCNEMVLRGLFGPIKVVTTTRELIDSGYASELSIQVVVLRHPDYIRKTKRSYHEELDFLNSCTRRNEFICDIIDNLYGNTLILFYKIEHGQIIFDMIKEKFPKRKSFFIYGGVDGEERDDVRGVVENEKDAIIVASFGTFSTGINIKRLHNIIMASGWKAQVMNLQSIGRGLRKGDDKTECLLFDITDDLSWQRRRNYTLNHSHERIKIYNKQQLDYKISKLKLDY